MRKFLVTVMVFYTALASASDQTKFEKVVGRYATSGSDPLSKAVCICRDAGIGIGRVGFLRRSVTDAGGGANVLEIDCIIPFFDAADGAYDLGIGCGSFEVVGR